TIEINRKNLSSEKVLKINKWFDENHSLIQLKDIEVFSYYVRFSFKYLFEMNESLLLEMSIESIKLEDIVNKQLIDYFMSDESVLDYVKMTYANENNLDTEQYLNNPNEDFEKSKEFREYFEYEVENMFWETRNKFVYDIIDDNDEISIWRQMRVGSNWLEHLEKQGQRLGIWWSWDSKAAESHWGYDIKEKPIKINIESKINTNYVNWPATIKANMHPTYEEEKEIQLFKNTPLKIVAIYDQRGNELDISKIKNKIFKA
ncbi:MAG: hypothetical protein WC554_08925, partial [Clostridia bacterium]